MSAPLPREPRPGERLDADWGRAVARALRSQRLSGGPGVRVSSGPDGTTVSIPGGAPGAGEGAAARPMPLDLSISTVDNQGVPEPHAAIRIGAMYVVAGTVEVEVDATRNAALATAMANVDESFDLGAFPAGGVVAVCLYVAAVVCAPGTGESGYQIRPRWGLTTGVTVAAAMQAVPARGGDDETVGSVRGILAAVPVGALSAYPGNVPLVQIYHGAVVLPKLDAATVLTGFQYEAGDHQLQIKTRKALVAALGDESAWTLANADAQAEVYP